MPSNLDVGEILEQEGERYLPLVHHILKRSNPVFSIPGEDRGRVRELRLMIVRRNALLFDELRKVTKAFNDAGIEVILLKGAMMEGIYPAGLRPFTDIDLLVRGQKVAEALEVLAALGYSTYAPQFLPGVGDLRCEGHCVKNGSVSIQIDLHWALSPLYPYSYRVEIEGLWRRAKRASVAGIDALVLSPEDSLLHLCLHLLHHCQDGWLASCCDIAELANHYEGRIDWEAFISRTFEFKVCLPVRYSLRKSFELFHPPVPLWLLDELGAYDPDRAERRIFTLLEEPDDGLLQGGRYFARVMAIPGTTRKLRYIWSLLFPSPDILVDRYHSAYPKFLPLYYLLHLNEAFLMALKTLIGFAFRGKKSTP